MGKGGGGGVDTSGLVNATNKATDLQEEIYNLTREDVQPWYQMGVGSVNRLSDLLGVSGGSVQDRQSIYDELLPQYTSEQTTSGTGGPFVNIGNRLINLDTFNPNDRNMMQDLGSDTYFGAQQASSAYKAGKDLSELGYDVFGSGGTTSSSTDYAGLNAAVDARLGGQETPEGYGSLLQTFGMDQFEADPGFQFRQDEANKMLERQMSAQGITLGGAGAGEINPTAYRAMTDLNQNLASQEYGASRGRYVEDQLNTFNMLMGSAGMGQNATGIMSGAGQNYATNVGNLQTGLASAQMNAQLSGQNSGGSMFGSLLGAGAGALLGNPGLGASIGNALVG